MKNHIEIIKKRVCIIKKAFSDNNDNTEDCVKENASTTTANKISQVEINDISKLQAKKLWDLKVIY